MGSTIESRLQELGVSLPQAAAPAANYVPTVRTGALLFTAGQLPFIDGKLFATGLLAATWTSPPAARPPSIAPSTCWRR